MELYKPEFTDKKSGAVKTCRNWYLRFADNRKIRHRLSGCSNKAATEKYGKQIDKILSSGGDYDKDLQESIKNLPEKMRAYLVKAGIIDSRAISIHIDKTLTEHLADFHSSLLAKENGQRYADQYKSRLSSIFTQCGFETWNDLDANKVYTFLAGLRGQDGIGQRTFNCYLKAAKQFCRWMIRERRATTNPLEHLSCITQTEKRLKRRALTLDEQRTLLESTEHGTTHHNMTGHERRLCYTLALQTGLRANEIRNLTVSSFDFAECSVSLTGAYTKNKKTAVIDLKSETAEEIKSFLAGKLPNVRAFTMPDQPSKMIQKDLESAKIPYKTDDGQADFHSLRHSFITNLARSGVYPKDAQELARHSTITLTMNCYTHTARESLRKIINEQPDLAIRQENKKIG